MIYVYICSFRIILIFPTNILGDALLATVTPETIEPFHFTIPLRCGELYEVTKDLEAKVAVARRFRSGRMIDDWYCGEFVYHTMGLRNVFFFFFRI